MNQHTLEVQRLSKWFDRGGSRVNVLRDISFTVRSGEMVALFGPSGSGKSTLLNLLALLDGPNVGCIEFDGQRLDAGAIPLAERFRATKLGLIFQDFNLIPTLSALENVEMGLLPLGGSSEGRRTAAAAMLQRVGLADRLHHRPAQLSGGQQQRVGVARALCKRPVVALVDEPTANLDSDSARTLFKLMHELASECQTVLLVATHDPRMLAQSDRVLRLEDGRLAS
jgi:ABC-type lipoprotein export system ATPase subunit